MSELRRILCVEDEEDIQAIARLALETVGGLEVRICSSGREALEIVEEYDPDLILLDVMMPGIDGPSTLRELRTIPAMKDCPVVFMTAKDRPHEVNLYRELGAAEVITKPFDPMTLADRVREIYSGLE